MGEILEENPVNETGVDEVNLVDELGDMPEPTETVEGNATAPLPVAPSLPDPSSVIAKPKKVEIPANAVNMVDTKGRSFDPELHATDEKGNAIITTKGTLKLLKRGRPSEGKGNTTSSAKMGTSTLNAPSAPSQAEIQAEVDETHARAVGVYAATALVTMGRLWGGDEWEPQKDPIDEKANLDKAFGDYFVAKEVTDLPAGLALSIAVLGYAAPRFFMPTTKQRTLTLWEKVKLWNAARKMKKERPKAVEKKPEDKPPEK